MKHKDTVEFEKESERRRVVANEVLATFSPASISKTSNGWFVVWEDNHGGKVSRRWQASKGNDMFPPWSDSFPAGATSITALSQLMRWLQRRPVFPISAWRYWSCDTVSLLSRSAVDNLSRAGYPTWAKCVLCDIELTSETGYAWWHRNSHGHGIDGLSGPCCATHKPAGCQQKKEAA